MVQVEILICCLFKEYTLLHIKVGKVAKECYNNVLPWGNGNDRWVDLVIKYLGENLYY